MKISISNLKLQLNNHKYDIILLFIITVLCFCFFYSHGNISTDTGREAMIPLAILNGEILYRDVLNIYAPFAYYINAFVFKIFGIRLESLYFAGAFSSIIFLYSIYKICTKFINKNISFFVTLFIALSCVYNTRLFNFIFPYSYSVTYGLSFYTLSLLLLLNFYDRKDKKLIYISAIFAGAAFACKIEFLPILLIVICFGIEEFQKSLSIALHFIVLSLIIPVISYGIPVIQGLTPQQVINSIEIFKKSAVVPSVIEFAKNTGTAFCTNDIVLWFLGTAFFLIFIIVCYFLAFKTKINIIPAIVIASLFHYILRGETHFAILPIVALLFFIFNFKTLLSDKKLFILAIAAIGASGRTIFNLNTNEYGAYTFPLLFSFLIVVVIQYFSSKNMQEKTEKFLTIFLCAGIISNTVYSYYQLKMYSFPIKTHYGRIDTTQEWKVQADMVFKYIANNTSSDNKILFLPEGSLFNFLSGRKTNMMMYALNAPYIETFGEEKIIQMISQDEKIKYIAIIDGFGLYNFNKKRYYFQKNKITEYIKERFILVFEEKNNGTEILILEKKKEG